MAMRKPKHVKMEDYWDNRSTTLIHRYDESQRKVRLETFAEREERLLSLPHTHRGYVGTETFLLADKANRENLNAPIKTRLVDIANDDDEYQMEEIMTEDIITYNKENSLTKWHKIWEQHPLWYRPEGIPVNTWLLNRDPIEVDRFGYHEALVDQIRELYADKLSPTELAESSRQPHENEKVLLSTQIALSCFLSENRASRKSGGRVQRKKAILHMIRRLRLSMLGNKTIERMYTASVTPNMDKLATRLSTNSNNWFSASGIEPSDIRTGYISHTSSTTMSDELRKKTRMDYELLLSYRFTPEECAEIVSAITGMTRSYKTIKEWGLDGSPREKKQSTQESEPMTTNNYESHTTQPSQNQGINSDEMLVQMATAMANGGMVDLVKEAMNLYELAKVEAEDEINQRSSTEVIRLREELSRVKGNATQQGSLNYYREEASANERGRNDSDKKLRLANEEIASLKRSLAEKEAELDAMSKNLQASALGGANIQNRIQDILKGTNE